MGSEPQEALRRTALGGRRAWTGRVRTRDAQASPPDGPGGLRRDSAPLKPGRWRRPGEGPSAEEGPPRGRGGHEGAAGPLGRRARFVGAGVGEEGR